VTNANHKFHKILDKIEITLVFVLLIITPLTFSGQYLSVYELPKLIWTSIISLLLLITLIFNKHNLKTSIIVAFGLGILVSIINLKYSIVLDRSLVGDVVINDSFIAYLTYFGLLAYFAHTLLSKKKIFNYVLYGGFILAILTIIHSLLLYFDITNISYDGRPTATIGQSNLLGGILASLIPLAYGYAKYYEFKSIKFNFIILSILTATLSTGSRGSLLAIIVFIIIEIFQKLKNAKLKIIFVLILITGSSFIIFSKPIDTDKLKLPYSVERLLSFKDRTQFHDQRFDLWKVGLRAFEEKPIVGWGNANFQNVYPMFLDINKDNREILFLEVESSHNQIVDLAVEFGAIGLISFLLFVIYVSFEVNSALKNSSLNKFEKMIIKYSYLGLVLTFTKGMTEFYSVINYVLIILFAGIILSFSKYELKNANISKVFNALMIFTALLCAIFISQIGTSERFEKIAMGEGDIDESLRNYEKAIEYNPYKQSLHNRYISLLYWAKKDEKMRYEIKNKKFNDYKTNFYFGLYFLDKDRAKTIDYLNEAKKLNKRDPQVFHYLGLIYYEMSEYDKSFENFDYAVKLDHKNFSDDYVYLADIEIRRGNLTGAASFIKLAAPSPNKDQIKNRIEHLKSL